MATTILFKTCAHCGRPHEREGGDFFADKFCNACSGERRAVAAAILMARPVTRDEIVASGRYLQRHSSRT
jgi:hypothetical protein